MHAAVDRIHQKKLSRLSIDHSTDRTHIGHTQPVIRAIGVSYTACKKKKMSFDKIFDLTAGVYFNFYNKIFEITF